jgi:hypothetical protein
MKSRQFKKYLYLALVHPVINFLVGMVLFGLTLISSFLPLFFLSISFTLALGCMLAQLFVVFCKYSSIVIRPQFFLFGYKDETRVFLGKLYDAVILLLQLSAVVLLTVGGVMQGVPALVVVGALYAVFWGFKALRFVLIDHSILPWFRHWPDEHYDADDPNDEMPSLSDHPLLVHYRNKFSSMQAQSGDENLGVMPPSGGALSATDSAKLDIGADAAREAGDGVEAAAT